VVGTVVLCALMPRFWRYDAAPVAQAEPISA
jgi:hypothetical protein